MVSFILKNASVITPLTEIEADVLINGAKIADIGVGLNAKAFGGDDGEIIDCSRYYVTPGLIDLQFNGNRLCDLWNSLNVFDFTKMCRELAVCGTTSFLPTLITASVTKLLTHIDFLKGFCLENAYDYKSELYTRVIGIHLEGPFISKDKPGVHPLDRIVKPDLTLACELTQSKAIKIMTMAQEEDGDFSVAKYLLEKNIRLSLGHSNASFDEAKFAFDHGYNLVTHLFNAMPPIHHRKPGLIPAALLADNVSVAIIPDGLHVDKNMIDLVVKTKGLAKVILVTDCAFIGTAGGGLVGSSLSLYQGVKNLVDWQICAFKDAIAMASYNPSLALGLNEYIGEVASGKLADLVFWDKNSLNIEKVMINGQFIG